PVAGIVHALAILLFVVAAAPLAGYLAMPALAALLIVTAWSMSEPHRWRARLRARPADRFLLFLTMILTVASNLTVAIAVGTAIGLAQRLARRDIPPAEWSPEER
ncbi:MAG: SulP family inorganic anion transporter, partial [Sphingomicrobium sp.]